MGVLTRETAWLDTGTQQSLMEASRFVQIIEHRQGQMVGCLGEIAFRMGFIDKEQLTKLAEPLYKSGYRTYLLNLID